MTISAMRRLMYEVCVESVEAALAAQTGGADRVELCADLLEGGITPSTGTIAVTREMIRIRLHVIIRPRGGDFCYSDAEFAVMLRDVETARALGADGIVIGVLNPDGSVDAERTDALISAARPMSITFHRAFDVTRDPFEALETLITLGADRVLTSGQEASALEGAEVIAELVRRADDRIIVMAGGGIREGNVRRVVAATGVREIHFTAGAQSESRMTYRNTRVHMGGALRPPEYSINATDPARVDALIATAEG
jgi:copper homeostasis protein